MKKARQKTRGYEPPGGERPSVLNLRAEFFAKVIDVAPQVVDDLFLRAFNVFWPPSLLSTPSRRSRDPKYPLEMSDLDKLVWNTPERMLIPGWDPSRLKDQSGLVGFYIRLTHSIRRWSDTYRINVPWCQRFAFRVLSRFWALCRNSRSVEPSTDLMAFVTKFLRQEHMESWRDEVEEMKQAAGSYNQVMFLFDQEQLREAARSGSPLPAELPVAPPHPPDFFPSRIQGHRILTRQEYEEEARSTLCMELLRRLQDISLLDRIRKYADDCFEDRRYEFESYCDAFEGFTQSCGWVETADKRCPFGESA